MVVAVGFDMKPIALAALLLASACDDSTSTSNRDLETQAAHIDECCKIEGGEVGIEDILVRLGSKSVLVHDWVAKTGSPGEFVGFSLTVGNGAALGYVVKAAGEVYESGTTTWIHPNGADGRNLSSGISNLNFCGECDNPDGCEGGGGGDGGGDGGGGGGGDGGDGDGCDNPDGCPTDEGGPILL
jgi:hypothetical protein